MSNLSYSPKWTAFLFTFNHFPITDTNSMIPRNIYLVVLIQVFSVSLAMKKQ